MFRSSGFSGFLEVFLVFWILSYKSLRLLVFLFFLVFLVFSSFFWFSGIMSILCVCVCFQASTNVLARNVGFGGGAIHAYTDKVQTSHTFVFHACLLWLPASSAPKALLSHL